jgi:hypothetical protein
MLLAMRRMSPTMPDAVFIVSDSGPWIISGLEAYRAVWKEKW